MKENTLFSKFEAIIKKTLVPIANKIDNQPHLNAVKKGMVVLTPMLLLGSVAAIFPAIPEFIKIPGVITWFENYGYLFDLITTVSLGFIGIYAVLGISYFLSSRYELYTIGAMVLALISFLLLALGFDEDGKFITKYLGSQGLFTGIFTSLISVEIYRFFTKHKLVIKMPEGVPDFVSSSFELITPTITIGLLFTIIRFVTDASTGGVLLPQVIMNMLAPAIGGLDSLWVVYFVIVLRLVFWFFGIHSAVLSPILSPIFVQYLAENIAAKEAGVALTHVATGGAFSAYVNFSGSGVTIGLVIAMLLSKSARYRKVGQVALVPSLFGINEPVLFGVPIILNPILMIPFIFGGALVGLFPLAMMKLGFLNHPFFDPPYVPVFMEGFLTGFDWRSIIIQVIQVIMSVALYFPFFKILEKQELEQEQENKKKAVVFSEEEAALIDDLDF